MRPPSRTRLEETRPVRAEGGAELLSHLVATRTDPRPKAGKDALHPAPRLDQPGDGPPCDPSERPSPSGVDSGGQAPHGIHEEDRQAIRRLDADEHARLRGDARVPVGRSLPRSFEDARAMDLSQQEEAAVRAKSARDPEPSSLPALPGSGALLEAVEKPRDGLKRGDPGRPERLAHAVMIHATLDQMQRPDGIVASALEVLEIEEVGHLEDDSEVFTPREREYALSKSDPERRLAARLAAKRACCRLLGGSVTLREIEVRRGAGPPRLALSPRAEARLLELGARRTLVSLTHGRTYAAASVLLLEH